MDDDGVAFDHRGSRPAVGESQAADAFHEGFAPLDVPSGGIKTHESPVGGLEVELFGLGIIGRTADGITVVGRVGNKVPKLFFPDHLAAGGVKAGQGLYQVFEFPAIAENVESAVDDDGCPLGGQGRRPERLFWQQMFFVFFE